MNRCTLSSAALAVFALLLTLTAAPATAQDTGYTGIITQDSVEVRSGAGRAYYVVGELEQGQRVHVVDVLFDETWYKVTVPTGIYSYVSRAFVNAQGDGSTGIINADRTEFKAASLRGPGESYRVQGTFNQGDRVQIVGQEGNFFKIIAPTDACVFIPAGSLRRATAEDMEPAQPEVADTDPAPADDEVTDTPTDQEPTNDDADTGDAGADASTQEEMDALDAALNPEGDAGTDIVEPELTEEQLREAAEGEGPTEPADESTGETMDEATDPATDTQAETDADTEDSQADANAEDAATDDAAAEGGLPALPDVEVTTPARSDALKARELELLPYFHTPIEERPLDHMEAGYRDILATGDLPEVDQRIVEVRLRTIARQREILAAMDRVAAARAVREPRTEIPDLEALPRTPVEYEAVGTLHVSSVYDGRSLPRMYRLVDPSGRTVAYVAPTPLIDESDLVQTLVGVVGSSSYDPALKLQIITPTRLDALAAQGE